MPNYYTQIMPQFTPVSYQEYLDPLLRLQQRHDQLDEKLGTYSDNLEDIKSQLDPVKDAALITQINNYNEGLMNAATTLGTKGVMGIDRVALNNLRKGYKTEVNPIGVAAMRRQEAIKTHDADALAHPDKVYDYDVNDSSVSDFMNGATPRGKSFSTDTLYKQAATSAAAISARKFFESKAGKDLGNQYWKIFKTQGIDSDTIAKFEADIRNSTDKHTADTVIQELRGIYNDTLKRNGLLTEDGEFDLVKEGSKIQASSAVLRGILDGIVYKEGSEYKDDKSYASPLQWANYNLSKRAQDRADEQWAANPANPDSPLYKGGDGDGEDSTNYVQPRGENADLENLPKKIKKMREDLVQFTAILQKEQNGEKIPEYFEKTYSAYPEIAKFEKARDLYIERSIKNPEFNSDTDTQLATYNKLIEEAKKKPRYDTRGVKIADDSSAMADKPERIKNPEYILYQEMKKKYGEEAAKNYGDNPLGLYAEAMKDYNRQIMVNRWEELNVDNNEHNLVNLLQNVTTAKNFDWDNTKQYITDAKGKKVSKEDAEKLFNDNKTRMSYNFATKQLKISNGFTIMYLDPNAALANIKYNGVDTVLSLLDAISEGLVDPSTPFENNRETYNNAIQTAFKAIYSNFQSGNVTNSESSSQVANIPF